MGSSNSEMKVIGMVLLDSLSPLRQAKNMSNILNPANHIKYTIDFIHTYMYSKDAYTQMGNCILILVYGG